MVRTPWGDSNTLRERMLHPGRGTPREAVLDNQRQRLFGAIVACVAQRGYAQTRVSDLIELAGVSRKAFYQHFADKRACFLAAIGSLVESGVAVMLAAYESEGEWEERVERGLEALMRLLAAQPAAARMCFVEVHAAGEAAIEEVERAFGEFEAVVLRAMGEMPERTGMPPEIVRALVGGLRKVIHTRLHRGREGELVDLVPQISGWGLSYLPPPTPLRAPRQRRADGSRGTDNPALEEREQAERLIRAMASCVAEKGYQATTVGDVVERAGNSLVTFYECFEGKEDAMLATLDRGGSLLVAKVGPAYRRGGEWPAAVHGALAALLAFGVEEPDFARLGVVEVYAAGERALAQRDAVMDGLTMLLAPGYELEPAASPIAAEAIAGAVYSLIHDRIKAEGPERLPELGPLATYITLAPFLGPEQACEVANGTGRRR